jgi:hypothetical protein
MAVAPTAPSPHGHRLRGDAGAIALPRAVAAAKAE